MAGDNLASERLAYLIGRTAMGDRLPHSTWPAMAPLTSPKATSASCWCRPFSIRYMSGWR